MYENLTQTVFVTVCYSLAYPIAYKYCIKKNRTKIKTDPFVTKFMISEEDSSSEQIIDKTHYTRIQKVMLKVLLLVGFIIIDIILDRTDFFAEFNKTFDIQTNSEQDLKYSILAICIFGPILEEIICRGFLYALIKSAFKTFKNSKPLGYKVAWTMLIIFNVLSFSLGHNLVTSISAGLGAIMLITLYEFTGKLRYGIILHIAHNTIPYLIAVFMTFKEVYKF